MVTYLFPGWVNAGGYLQAGFQAHEREIVELATGLGFTLTYPHSKAHVLVESEEKIVGISMRAKFIKNCYFEVGELMEIN